MSKQIPDNILQATFLMSAIIQRIERKRMDAKPEAEAEPKTEPPEGQKPKEGENGYDEQ